MQKTAIGVVAAIIVVAGGWYFYMQGGTLPAGTTADTAGSVKPDARLVVGESIMGKWQSTEDAKYVREFKDFNETTLSGTVVDYYDGKQMTTGTYQTYTKQSPVGTPAVALEDNAVYVQLVAVGTQADTLNFKVISNPAGDELTLIYLERGGALNFKLIQ